VALWLYAGLSERVPGRARGLIAADRVHVSPLVALELSYMHEIGRARDPVPTMLAALQKSLGIELTDVSLSVLTDAAVALTWTRDPFDRLISAHAIVADAPLITADRTILEHLPLATWD
jgi:PIN domain nuclease of toxin-antitoxin system